MVVTLFEDLPLEVLALIFDQVDSLKELCSFMLVSHRFYDGVSHCRRGRAVNEIKSSVGDADMCGSILIDRGRSILHACVVGNARLVRLLDVTIGEAYCCLPVMCLKGHLECVQILATRFDLLNVDQPLDWPSEGEHFAAIIDSAEVDLSQHDLPFSLAGAFQIACHQGHIEIVKYLHGKYRLQSKDVETKRSHALLAACWRGRTAVVSYLLEHFEHIFEDEADDHPFGAACAWGNMSTVEAVYSALSPSRVVMLEGFMRACYSGFVETAKFVHAKIVVTREEVLADTVYNPLVSACINGHLELLRYLHTTFDLTSTDMEESGASRFAFIHDDEILDYAITHMGCRR
eukprot:TRINITY_DN4200_c0_g2_i1.p1 TRINITY_DN4200_c0_g2~~TRINITY_DN4200_c0_g2_i1.p1  ORF type:complete len:347 (-),score=44.38 TRINITY_DN4200_c0_g2_i1:54-1094(-)